MRRLTSSSAEYSIWKGIIARCTLPATKGYKNYGGRGIRIHDDWLGYPEGFNRFVHHIGQRPSSAHTVDRINVNGNYEPGNCRWATKSMQSRNTRRTIKIDGMCLKDACNERGLSYEAVQMRLRRGDPLELALSPLIGRAYRAMLAAASDGDKIQ